MTQKNSDNLNEELAYSIEEELGLAEYSNRDLMYQQDNATKVLLNAIKDSEYSIKSTISDSRIGLEKEGAMEQNINMTHDDCEKCVNNTKDLLYKYAILDSKISNTNKILSIVGTVIGLILTVIIFTVNVQYTAINDSVNSKFDSINTEIKAINQRLDYQEKLNSAQIQRDVAIEIKNQKQVK